MNKITNILGVLFLALTLHAPQPAVASGPFTLDAVRAQVKQDFAGVPQLPTQALADQLRKGADILLLDVREKAEFTVSRIKGAERVDPAIRRSRFMNRFGGKARGKSIVFYCSVGMRSSRLAASVLAALKAQGATAVYNLDGGVFAWHNETRELVNGAGATNFVHPFDSHWGKLVERQALVKSTP